MDQRIIKQMTEAVTRLNELSTLYHPDASFDVMEIAGCIVKAISALRLVDSSLQQGGFRSARAYIQKVLGVLDVMDASELTMSRIDCLSRAIGRLQSTMSLNIAISSIDLNHLERALSLQGLVSNGMPSPVGHA